MLQQTQVRVVIPYYHAFMNRFADVEALANAREDDVLSHWAGLGYYARARNLHHASQQVRDQFAGRIPNTLDDLMALKGVGRSTAGAILSLGFGQRGVIQDGNVRRVFARIFGIEGDLTLSNHQRKLWDIAEELTPKEGREAAIHTQAMMDLGALLCTRHSPGCHSCPFQNDCFAQTSNRISDFPQPKRIKQRDTTDWIVLEVRNSSNQILLGRRPAEGIWGGLFTPPIDESLRNIENALGLPHLLDSEEQQIKEHAFSHFKVRLHHMRHFFDGPAPSEFEWTDLEGFQGGLPAPIAQLLSEENPR
jgi:A/G-specific adenine glycosylase